MDLSIVLDGLMNPDSFHRSTIHTYPLLWIPVIHYDIFVLVATSKKTLLSYHSPQCRQRLFRYRFLFSMLRPPFGRRLPPMTNEWKGDKWNYPAGSACPEHRRRARADACPLNQFPPVFRTAQNPAPPVLLRWFGLHPAALPRGGQERKAVIRQTLTLLMQKR